MALRLGHDLERTDIRTVGYVDNPRRAVTTFATTLEGVPMFGANVAGDVTTYLGGSRGQAFGYLARHHWVQVVGLRALAPYEPCGFTPNADWLPCPRQEGHDGPCARPGAGDDGRGVGAPVRRPEHPLAVRPRRHVRPLVHVVGHTTYYGSLLRPNLVVQLWLPGDQVLGSHWHVVPAR